MRTLFLNIIFVKIPFKLNLLKPIYILPSVKEDERRYNIKNITGKTTADLNTFSPPYA
jgi:hypothetical protein